VGGGERENSRGACIGSNACDFQGTRDALLWLSHQATSERASELASGGRAHLASHTCWRSAHERVHRIGCCECECVCTRLCPLQIAMLVNHAPRTGAENYSLEFRVHRCSARSLNLENVLVTFLTRIYIRRVKCHSRQSSYFQCLLCAVDTFIVHFCEVMRGTFQAPSSTQFKLIWDKLGWITAGAGLCNA
jgi:hypothetical protein